MITEPETTEPLTAGDSFETSTTLPANIGDDDIPSYGVEATPDPNDPNSPDVFILLDDDGIPLGVYTKTPQDDGTFIYLDDDGIPLGGVEFPQPVADEWRPLPKTGLGGTSMFWTLVFLAMMVAAATLFFASKRKKAKV